jgi:hypothetical protein
LSASSRVSSFKTTGASGNATAGFELLLSVCPSMGAAWQSPVMTSGSKQMIARVNNAAFLLIESIIQIYQHENTSTYLLHPEDLSILDYVDMDFSFNFDDIDFDILNSFDSSK